ncbi:MAG: tRNA (adenosine(37)-N6)-dimethylallyltransferase MiaA [Acidimicrobiales bacterium]
MVARAGVRARAGGVGGARPLSSRVRSRRPGHVALVGVTASGKSALAASLAGARPEADLVSVDSMTVYRGMDIGTSKPSRAEAAQQRYHLLDVADPSEEFTVARFQALVHGALDEIEARRRRALLVGGTGLYLRAVIDDLDLPGRWPDLSAQLELEADMVGVAAMHARLAALDPIAASRTTTNNRRRIVRALEVTVGAGRPFSSFGPGLTTYPPSYVTLVGIAFDGAAVDAAIEARLHSMMDAGFVDEVRKLAARPEGLSRTARQALGYRELLAHVEDGADLDECIQRALTRTRAFARRQWAWFRRDPRIHWLDPDDLLSQLLECWDSTGDLVVGDLP